MAIDETKRFTFVSQGLPEDTFSVVKFKGTEGISRLYEFDITLASDDGEIDLKGVVQNPATLTIKGGDQDLPIHGAVSQFEQLQVVKGHFFYRALLVPRLRQASLYHENQLFLDKKVPDIIEEILKQAGLTTQDYELKLTRNYPQWEYICQYRETDFDFISRWMEREGIYYYFEQGEQNEKIIITDSSTAHKDIPGDATIPYFPPSGLAPEEEAIKAFLCTQKMLPKKVILKDYNYRKPSLELKAEAEVDSKGRGDVYLYGEHFKDPGQGNELAKIRAEEIKCRENIFHGEGTAPNLCPGFFFELEGHYREAYNRKYLILEVEHEGHQTGSFWAGVGKEPAEGEEKLTYANRFTAIPSDVQFRPERTTPKSKFFGTMNATVDAAGDGQQAEIDDQGRYKVKLPFDQSGNQDGKASRWVRMAQPYSGFNASDGIKGPSGMHFPLHKGTEVILTFVDGDPDRPIIAGSIPNPRTISPVTQENQTKSVIRDNYGNEIVMNATPGDEHIRLYSPHHKSGLDLGRSVREWSASDKALITGGNSFAVGAGMKSDIYGGAKSDLLLGFRSKSTFGHSYTWTAGLSTDFKFGRNYEYNWARKSTVNKDHVIQYSKKDILSISGKDHVLCAGDQMCLVGGASGDEAARSIVNIYPGSITLTAGGLEVEHKNPDDPKMDEKQLYKNYIPKDTKIWRGVTSIYALSAALLAVAVPGITEFIKYEEPPDPEPPGWVPSKNYINYITTGIGGLLALVYSIVGGVYFVEGMVKWAKKLKKKAEFVEPVEHEDPAAKIKMHEDGLININSKKKKIRLAITEGKEKYGDQKKKIWLDSNQIGIMCGKSVIYIARDGTIEIKTPKNVDMAGVEGTIKLGKKVSIDNKQVKLSQKLFHKNFLVVE